MGVGVESSHVLISSRCVNDCVFCAVANKRKAGALSSREEILRFMEKMATAGVKHLTFSGAGEPTLDEHFEEYLDYAHQLGFPRIQLFTNGHAVSSDKVQAWKRSGLGQVLLSLHGLEGGHDRNVRRRGSFREALQALDTFLAEGLQVNVNTCLTRHNLDEIAELCALVDRYPVGRHMLSFPEWHGACLANPDQLLCYQQVRDLCDDVDFFAFPRVVFDNTPFCIARHRTRELSGLGPVVLLDADQEHTLAMGGGNRYLGACESHSCPVRHLCCGFDPDYIAHHGWGALPGLIEGFFRQFDFTRLRPLRSGSGGFRLSPPLRRPAAHRAEPDTAGEGIFNLILKPTARCNGSCAYCAARSEAIAYADLSVEDAVRICGTVARTLRERGERHLQIVWHGGEPLLMGREFFREVLSWCRQNLEAPRVSHSVQSNLLLLDEQWIDLFGAFDVRLSTSVEPVVEGLRVFADGSEQFPGWFERFRLAMRRGVKVGIVYTVTAHHLGREEKIYNYFRNLLATYRSCSGVRFSPIYAAGRAGDGSRARLLLTDQQYATFLQAMQALWSTAGRRLAFEPFRSLAGGHRNSCALLPDCSRHFLAVDGQGRVSPCGRFLDSRVFIGSIYGDDFPTLQQKARELLFEQRALRLAETECQGCPDLERCHGGCPYLAYLYGGDASRKEPFCAAHRALFASTRG